MRLCFSGFKIIFYALFLSSAGLAAEQLTNPPLKEISPGVFQVGSVRLDKVQKSICFPAEVNMTNGLIEYFVVTGTGKLHESVLKTETQPSQIHIAMLLLGAKESETNRSSAN